MVFINCPTKNIFFNRQSAGTRLNSAKTQCVKHVVKVFHISPIPRLVCSAPFFLYSPISFPYCPFLRNPPQSSPLQLNEFPIIELGSSLSLQIPRFIDLHLSSNSPQFNIFVFRSAPFYCPQFYFINQFSVPKTAETHIDAKLSPYLLYCPHENRKADARRDRFHKI